jgi:hypothetical protein
VVSAPDAATAVRAALSGTVTVQHLGREFTHTFGRDTVSESRADHKAFWVDVGRGGATVRLEDLAGSRQSDWDYDDRSWRVSVREYPNQTGGEAGRMTVLAEGYNYWFRETPQTEEKAKVEYKVSEYDPDTLLWQYTVTNIDLIVSEPKAIGLVTFDIASDPSVEIIDPWTSTGWDNWVNPEGEPSTFWVGPGEAGHFVVPGQTAYFSFKTPIVPIVESAGMSSVSGFPHIMWFASGTTMAPGEVIVDIDIDVDRDRIPESTKPPAEENAEGSYDEKHEESIGTIVIADRGNVYRTPPPEQPHEPARRRTVIISTNAPDGAKVRAVC